MQLNTGSTQSTGIGYNPSHTPRHRSANFRLSSSNLIKRAARFYTSNLSACSTFHPDESEGGIFETTLRPSDRAINRASDRAIDRSTRRSSDRAIERSSDGATERTSDRATERPSDGATDRSSDRASDDRASDRASDRAIDGDRKSSSRSPFDTLTSAL